MSSLKLTDTLWWNGALDPDTHISDVIVQMEFGTTYNSYTLKGSEKTALIETSKYKFWEAFKGELDDAVDITKVDYIIIDHNNGYETYYGHMNVPSPLQVGDVVDKGDVIGQIGMTGLATGPHTHFFIMYEGERYNPCDGFLPC